MQMDADLEERVICHKDSRDVTQTDRRILQLEIERAHESGVRHFLVTHGTYTMADTGVFLQQHLPPEVLSQVSIVITGAMYPMNLIGGDGLLNLGASVSTLINTATPLGCVVSMHGRNWDPSLIEKDSEKLLFRHKAR